MISLPVSLLWIAATGPLMHPSGPGDGQLRLALGAELGLLSRALVEAELRAFPHLVATAAYGVTPWLTLELGISALVIDNEVRLGARYHLELGPMVLGFSDRFAFEAGYVGFSGFDAGTWSLSNVPSLSIGTRVNESFLSLAIAARFALAREVSFGTATITPRFATFVGTIWSLFVESPVGTGLIYGGVELLWTIADDQLWLAFSDAKGKLVYPRLSVGYAF